MTGPDAALDGAGRYRGDRLLRSEAPRQPVFVRQVPGECQRNDRKGANDAPVRAGPGRSTSDGPATGGPGRRRAGRRDRFGVRVHRQRNVAVTPNRLHQLRSRGIHATGAEIDPLRLAPEILEGWCQRGLIRTERNDRPALGRGALDLLADVRGGDGVFRQHEREDLGAVDRPHDAVRVQRSGDHVPRGDQHRSPCGSSASTMEFAMAASCDA
jgi:hypothetical protein